MPEKFTDVYNEIARKAARKGISLNKLTERVGVTPIMLQQWKRRTPKSIATYRAIMAELEGMEDKA